MSNVLPKEGDSRVGALKDTAARALPEAALRHWRQPATRSGPVFTRAKTETLGLKAGAGISLRLKRSAEKKAR